LADYILRTVNEMLTTGKQIVA